MQQADNIVDDDAKRLAASLGIAMADLNRDLLMLAKQHFGIVIVAID